MRFVCDINRWQSAVTSVCGQIKTGSFYDELCQTEKHTKPTMLYTPESREREREREWFYFKEHYTS